MATNPSTLPENVGRITAPDANYPYGSAKNDSTGTTGDGTPIVKPLLDDTYGFYQAALRAASITPSGSAETALVSQVLQAQAQLAQGRAEWFDEDGTSAADAYVLAVRGNQQAVAGLFDGQRLRFATSNANTGSAVTVDVSLLLEQVAGTAVVPIVSRSGGAPSAGDMLGRCVIEYDSGANRYVLIDGDGVRANAAGAPPLFELDATVSANALTLTLSPARIDFRADALATGGVTSTVIVTSPVSLTVSAGSTLGTVSGVKARLIVLAINDGGTVRLGVVNEKCGLPLFETSRVTTTAEGGTGGADSGTTVYADVAVTNKPYRVVGIVQLTQATAGTWTSAPTLISGGGGRVLEQLDTRVFTNVTRTAGVAYQNPNGHTLAVYVRHSSAADANACQVSKDGITWVSVGGSISAYTVTNAFDVPPYWFYKLNRIGDYVVELA